VLRDYLLVLLFTGLRRSEALCLRRDNVDLKLGTLRVIDTKNGSDHLFPMGNYLWNLMRARSRISDSEWVFAKPAYWQSHHRPASPDRERCRKERRPVLSARPAANLRLDCESPRRPAELFTRPSDC
jgi:integrase